MSIKTGSMTPFKKNGKLTRLARRAFKSPSAAAKMTVSAFLVEPVSGVILSLLRAENKDRHAETWSIPGGGVRPGKTPLQEMIREIYQETGYHVPKESVICIESNENQAGKKYIYFIIGVSEIFEPKLNHEHVDSQWTSLNKSWPRTAHDRIKQTFARLGAAKIRQAAQHSLALQGISSPSP